MAKYDKSMEYISQTQTLIGQQRKRLVDQDTGELMRGRPNYQKGVRTKAVLENLSYGLLQVLGGLSINSLMYWFTYLSIPKRQIIPL